MLNGYRVWQYIQKVRTFKTFEQQKLHVTQQDILFIGVVVVGHGFVQIS
jgi:hypothetical protein